MQAHLQKLFQVALSSIWAKSQKIGNKKFRHILTILMKCYVYIRHVIESTLDI